MTDHLDVIGRVLDRANRKDLAQLNQTLRLLVDYVHRMRVAECLSRLRRVWMVCVRGGTRTLTTRLELNT
ncbi:hypothetical protein EV648_12360 [Kribbella sp. VKM Ac-2568]|nr:hypothetical protein EV648_12360 [Kribbella sp. VKM Ac-2568]